MLCNINNLRKIFCKLLVLHAFCLPVLRYAVCVSLCLVSYQQLVLADNCPPNFEILARAVYHAEGGSKASRPYGVFFDGCSWNAPEYCKKIAINTFRNNWRRYESSESNLSYLEFLRDRYAPLSDHDLNKNWLNNVSRLYKKMGGSL